MQTCIFQLYKLLLPPQIIDLGFNKKIIVGINHTKTIIVSIIFAVILTLFFSNLIINKKNKL